MSIRCPEKAFHFGMRNISNGRYHLATFIPDIVLVQSHYNRNRDVQYGACVGHVWYSCDTCNDLVVISPGVWPINTAYATGTITAYQHMLMEWSRISLSCT